MNYIIIILLLFSYAKSNNIIVTNHPICTKIASNILKKGSIIDTAINIMLCEGIVAPQDSGIGGGFYGIFNINNQIFLLNARERTPEKIKFRNQIHKKYCNIGIPGAIKGYEVLHKKYGKLSWSSIIKPIIRICYRTYNYKTLNIIKHYRFNKILPYNRALCRTLIELSFFGPKYFYKYISRLIINDLKPYNKYITYKDFITYKPVFDTPSYSKYQNYTIFSTKYPAVGKFIHSAFRDIINNKNLFEILNKTYINISKDRYYRYFHKPQRHPILGNKHGTTNICIKKNKDYLCITSTINLYFGSGFYSKTTGIILNNQLDDIPIYYNKIPSRMIPPSSISTTIIKKNNKLDIILGGSGGSRIPAGIINVLYNFYRLNQTLKDSVYNNRYFYFNNKLEIESSRSYNNIIPKYNNINHIMVVRNSYNTVTGLTRFNGSYDPRRGGLVYINT